MKNFHLKALLYGLTILHIPFTVIRTLICVVIIVDGWCDKIIDEMLKSVTNKKTLNWTKNEQITTIEAERKICTN